MKTDSKFLEQTANNALFSTDHQVKKKAEQDLYHLLFQIDPNKLVFIFENHSSNVLLTSVSCLAFWAENFPKLERYINAVNSVLRSWFRAQDGRFIRPNQQQELEPHIINTIFHFLGKALKVLYLQPRLQKEVIDWLLSKLQGDKYRLFLFYYFIEQVSLFDSTLDFLTYKTLLQSFQESIIPTILTILSQQIMLFSNVMIVEGLTEQLQNNLQLNQGTRTPQNPNAMTKVAQVMFRLLEEIVSFRYNISFKDCDEGQNSKAKVSFPQGIIHAIIKRKFLQALYILLRRLLELGNIHQFQKCLGYLEKILNSRISVIPADIHSKFIQINIKGMVDLLDYIIKNNNKISIQSVGYLIRCIIKFQDIFGQFGQQRTIQPLQQTKWNYFLDWVLSSFKLSLLVLHTKLNLDTQNYLFLGAVAVIRNMGIHIHNLKQQSLVLVVTEEYKKFVEVFIQHFFFGNYQIQGSVDFSTMQTLGKQINKFYKHLVPVCSLFYMQIFVFLNKRMNDQQNLNLQHNYLNIANLFFFVTAMINDQVFFDADLFNNQPLLVKNGEYVNETLAKNIGSFMITLFQFLEVYSNEPRIQSLNHAIVMFLEALLIRFSSKTEVVSNQEEMIPSVSIKIKDTLLQVLTWQAKNDEQTLLMLFMTSLLKFAYCTRNQCIQFIMKTIHSSISNLKRAYKKAQIHKQFRNITIYPQLEKLLKELIFGQVDTKDLRWRVKLFKTLGLLWYDDTLDNYRANIRSSIQLIIQYNQQPDRTLYNFIGILEGIDSTQIYQDFMGKFLAKTNYKDFMENLLNSLTNHPVLLKDFLYLTYLIIRPREGDSIHARQLYKMICLNLPFWNNFLINIKDRIRIEATQLFEELYLIMGALIGQKHINLSLLESHQEIGIRDVQNFIIYSVTHFKTMLKHIDQLPEMVNKYYNIVSIFLSKLPSFLYNYPDDEAANQLTLYINQLMLKIVRIFDKVVLSEYSIQQLQKQLNLCNLFFSYFVSCKPFINKFVTTHHISQLHMTASACLQFLGTAFKLGLNFGPTQQYPTLIHILSKLCFDMCQLLYNHFEIEAMMKHIGMIKQQDKGSFIRIMRCIREGKETEWIMYQIKDWFKEGLRFSDQNNQSSTFDGY